MAGNNPTKGFKERFDEAVGEGDLQEAARLFAQADREQKRGKRNRDYSLPFIKQMILDVGRVAFKVSGRTLVDLAFSLTFSTSSKKAVEEQFPQIKKAFQDSTGEEDVKKYVKVEEVTIRVPELTEEGMKYLGEHLDLLCTIAPLLGCIKTSVKVPPGNFDPDSEINLEPMLCVKPSCDADEGE